MCARNLLRRTREAIVEAFGDLVHDGGDRLYEGELADNYGQETSLTRRLASLTYEHWLEIPDWAIADSRCALSYFGPESFRLHLPAYMVWTLDNLGSTSPSADMTIYALLPYDDDPDIQQRRLERFAAFDEPQREAIRSFLRFAAEHDGDLDGHAAREALEKFWDSE